MADHAGGTAGSIPAPTEADLETLPCLEGMYSYYDGPNGDFLVQRFIRLLAAERERAGRLETLLRQCGVVMKTAVLHGVTSILPPDDRDSWRHAHVAAFKELDTTTAKGAAVPPGVGEGGAE